MTITCADCGETQVIPDLPPRGLAECHRCDRLLVRRTTTGVDLTLACAIAIMLVLPPAVFMPLMDSSIKRLVFDESRLVSSVPVIYSEVWFPFAFGFLFFAFLFPAVRAALQIVVLASLRLRWKIPQRGRIFRWSEELRIWSMTDVVVIAGVIAYFRANISADVEIRIGAWCYVAVAALSVISERSLDRRAVWSAILPDPPALPHRHVASCDVCEMTVISRRPGDTCPRCGSRLDRRIEPRFVPALAAVAAAIPLCLPAYTASIIVNDQLTGVLEHTVFGTVQLLADRGYWQIGVVMIVAGVVIPVIELVGLFWLLARVRFPSRRGLVVRTRVYRVLQRLIRWPMVIPFVAAIAAPIVDFRGIDDIFAGPGATPLFLVIALIMLAVRLFEPRLMWKTAGELTT
ncbi:MAG TPA: paraquat-inducible protein A [Thermoanaerobaculia bacterium]|jgi:paraquat-inducible protein A|nr:paraquat-inducible protein A [Thermoanaerobaculia bacterium]